MVAHHALAEVVEHHAFASSGAVELRVAAVEEVGVPDEDVAFLSVENGFLQAQLGNASRHEVFIHAVVFVADEPAVALVLVVGIEVIRQLMTARIVVQRSVGVVDVFEREPHAQHAASGVGGHVDGVAMRMLLAAGEEVDAVEQPRFALQQHAQKLDQIGAEALAAHIFGAQNELGEFVAVTIMDFAAVEKLLDFGIDGVYLLALQKTADHGKALVGIGQE